MPQKKPAQCPVCARYADEVAYLRQQLAEEREERKRLQAQPPPAPPPAIDPKFVGEHGEPLVEMNGKMIPLDEYDKAMRGLEAALAGRAIETDKEKENPL